MSQAVPDGAADWVDVAVPEGDAVAVLLGAREPVALDEPVPVPVELLDGVSEALAALVALLLSDLVTVAVPLAAKLGVPLAVPLRVALPEPLRRLATLSPRYVSRATTASGVLPPPVPPPPPPPPPPAASHSSTDSRSPLA